MSETTGVVVGQNESDIHSEPSALIALAVQRDLDISKLERLLELKREWDAAEARRAFLDSLSAFQTDCPPITKSDRADMGRGGSRRYASLGTIAESIRPILQKHGLSFRFRQAQSAAEITITCIVSHREGHSEETSLTASADLSGAKNPLQSIGSTITYLQRYTLVSSLGLTTVDDDDDATTHQPAAQQSKPPTAAEVLEKMRAKAAELPSQPDETQAAYVVDGKVVKEVVRAAADEATADQRLRITTLFGQLGLTADQRDAVLRKRGVSSVRSLTQGQAAELLKNLEAKYLSVKTQRANEEAAAVLGESRQPDEAHQMLRSGPASAVQVEEAKRLLTELEQLEPGITGKLKAKLVESGFQRLADLCFDDAEQLVIGLNRRNVETFFGAMLRRPVAAKEESTSEANGADPT